MERAKDILAKVQKLPEHQKKVIFVAVMALTSIGMFFFALKFTRDSVPQVAKSVQSIDASYFRGSDSETFHDTGAVGTENPQDTGNMDITPVGWKTYQSSALGFSMKYPDDMVVSKSSDKNFSGITFVKAGASQGSNDPNIINICPKDCLSTPHDYQTSNLVTQSVPIVVDHMPARAYFSDEKDGYKVFVYFLQTPNQSFVPFDEKDIAKGGWIAIKLNNRDSINEIINSFKFIQ